MNKRLYLNFKYLFGLLILLASCKQYEDRRVTIDFTDGWYFRLSSDSLPSDFSFDPDQWRKLDLPHDWSIEGQFSKDHPAGIGGGALPGGIGWYQKTFEMSEKDIEDKVFIQFDGIYQLSSVWINGHLLGTRPNGYISFQYDLTPYLKSAPAVNVIQVKVDNLQQPNSRWYSGSGIYRDVRLVKTNDIHFAQWGTYIQSKIQGNAAEVLLAHTVKNEGDIEKTIVVTSIIKDDKGVVVGEVADEFKIAAGTQIIVNQKVPVANPQLWSVANPSLYLASAKISENDITLDDHNLSFGIRSFEFDSQKGFSLNGESMKIKGVCLHHDLGCLGAAFNKRAMQRQLEIMKAMGVNAVRTSHNPPAPQLLDLCDEMGLLVMDEMFDMWAAGKTEFDYSNYWDEWHQQDLQDFILRDRNHPSIIVWSVGNEIIEQYNHEDSTGGEIAQELAGIVRALDDRPITTANNDPTPGNPLIKLGGLDLVGYNYHHEMYADFPKDFPDQKFIATETNSSLATRGHYDMPSDSVRIWPIQWDLEFTEGNPDNTVSAYDHVRAPWGSTQEDTWRIVKKHDFLSGIFIWTGFDYIGEPTPYTWPSRSSYFGLADLAGFPKDSYYMYQSEWTDEPMLHVFPHWNWSEGQEIDIWAYYNHADEVELFLNGRSLGTKQKGKDEFHVMWRVPFEPGELKAVSRKNGSTVLEKNIKTAGKPAKITLSADRKAIAADGDDLSFVTVTIQDENGTIMPIATNLIEFEISGEGKIAGVDNGDPTSHLSMKGNVMKAMAGKCLAVIQSTKQAGKITLKAKSDGLEGAEIVIESAN